MIILGSFNVESWIVMDCCLSLFIPNLVEIGFNWSALFISNLSYDRRLVHACETSFYYPTLVYCIDYNGYFIIAKFVPLSHVHTTMSVVRAETRIENITLAIKPYIFSIKFPCLVSAIYSFHEETEELKNKHCRSSNWHERGIWA